VKIQQVNNFDLVAFVVCGRNWAGAFDHLFEAYYVPEQIQMSVELEQAVIQEIQLACNDMDLCTPLFV
jgi:hypothetical protein